MDQQRATSQVLSPQYIRQFGYVVLTTNVGILTHDEARERHVGGKVLGFFY